MEIVLQQTLNLPTQLANVTMETFLHIVEHNVEMDIVRKMNFV